MRLRRPRPVDVLRTGAFVMGAPIEVAASPARPFALEHPEVSKP